MPRCTVMNYALCTSFASERHCVNQSFSVHPVHRYEALTKYYATRWFRFVLKKIAPNVSTPQKYGKKIAEKLKFALNLFPPLSFDGIYFKFWNSCFKWSRTLDVFTYNFSFFAELNLKRQESILISRKKTQQYFIKELSKLPYSISIIKEGH